MTVNSAAALDSARAVKRFWQPAGLDAFSALFDRSDNAAHIATWERMMLFLLVAIGAWTRFYGMGSWGLEYDEETMAMPVRHILEHGVPAMPSGMGYVRSILQLYVMAGSVWLFGESEWALRLPSALCGLALIVTCFYIGRRFLTPVWNLGFVAAVTFLPAMILDSQEARMYTFLLTSINLFTLFVFKWEASGRTKDLVWAVVWMMIAIQFHSLAIFAAFIVFMPGLLKGDAGRLLYAMAAFAVMAISFVVIDGWVESFFPPRPKVRGVEVTAERHVFADVALTNFWILMLGVIAAGVLARSVYKQVATHKAAIPMVGFLVAGFLAQLLFFYHVAFLLFAVAALLAFRSRVPLRFYVAVTALGLAITGCHVWLLLEKGIPVSRDLIAALVGMPSPWTYLRFMTYAPGAAAVIGVAGLFAIRDLARRQKISDAWLFAGLSIWLPLFLIGCFTWYPQLRYTEIALLPMVLCAFVFAAKLLNGISHRSLTAVAASVICLIVIDPRATASVINAGYSMHPDHKGAAEYIQSVRAPNDILLAEDVLQQTYYLGGVDFWLIGASTADLFSYHLNDVEVDIYTHTPVMTNAQQVHELMARPNRGTIYIIGSGEQHSDGRRHARGESLAKLLGSGELEVVYQGRDDLTKVWRIPPLPVPSIGERVDAAEPVAPEAAELTAAPAVAMDRAESQ